MNDILIDRSHGSTATITFNRPDKRNAINYRMWEAIADAFESFETDEQVRVIILTGAGGSFSAGADISEFPELRSNAALGEAYDEAVERGASAMMHSSKPVIAAIDGYCVGGGLGLAIACDFRIASANASFAIPAARLGIVYGSADSRNLMNLVGLSQAKRILFSGEFIGASRAVQIGLVDEVTAQVMTRANELADTLAANAPLSIRGSKRLLNRIANVEAHGLAEFERELIAQAMNSEDYKEGVKAFAEKRKPRFLGR